LILYTILGIVYQVLGKHSANRQDLIGGVPHWTVEAAKEAIAATSDVANSRRGNASFPKGAAPEIGKLSKLQIGVAWLDA
jgi:hypothetical protein